ncbi:MAG TPA: DUF3987 domain-containing protein [Blastocatellia bacterium]|jgi:hypothetical protein|nr:DUF3987 domain-containing protein [Blastocatellia bacterium]
MNNQGERGPLAADYAELENKSWLTREIVDAAKIQRVNTIDGAEIVGRPATASKDYAGLIFPYFWPGDPHEREYRLRRDNPDLERRADGSIKEKDKYLGPRKSINRLYIPPGTPVEWLTDATIPVTFTEGEKKALALWRFYCDRGEKRLVIGISGAWNFRGVVGKVTNGKGKPQDISGIIFDFDRIEWRNREVLIVFDVNVLTDESVAAARRELAREVQRRGAVPYWVNLPTGIDGVNGVDDLLARCGPGFLAGLLATVTTVTESWESPSQFDEYDLPPFPVDALPDWLARYVEGLAITTQTPVDMAAMLGITNISSTLAGNIIIRVREDWTETPNIYSVTALEVGNRKTAVHSATSAPLKEKERELIRDAQQRISDAQVERDMLSASLEGLKKAAAKAIAKGDDEEFKRLTEKAKEIAGQLLEKTVPAVPKLIASGDITPESVASNLAEQGGRLLISSDEGELFQLLAGRYGNGANFEIFLKGHTGEEVRVDRRSRSEIIERATLTVAMTVQPDVLRSIAENPTFRARGLTARMLFTMPPSLVGRRSLTPPPLNEEARNEYHKRVKKLAALAPVENEDGKLIPRTVSLSADAVGYLLAFAEEIEPQLSEGGALRSIGDWANKLAGATARLAAIVHYADKAFEAGSIMEIPAKAVQRAILIARYLIPHAQAACAEMGVDPEIQDARKLLQWIETAKSSAESTFTRREAQRQNHNAFQKVTDLKPALTLLEAHGYIRPVDAGRRDSQKFEINPAVWRLAKTKIQHQGHGDSSDTSLTVSETPLTDKASTVTTVTVSPIPEIEFAASVNGSHPSVSSANREVFNL